MSYANYVMPLGIELLCYMKLMGRKVPKAFLLYNARYTFMEGGL